MKERWSASKRAFLKSPSLAVELVLALTLRRGAEACQGHALAEMIEVTQRIIETLRFPMSPHERLLTFEATGGQAISEPPVSCFARLHLSAEHGLWSATGRRLVQSDALRRKKVATVPICAAVGFGRAACFRIWTIHAQSGQKMVTSECTEVVFEKRRQLEAFMSSELESMVMHVKGTGRNGRCT
eukprot:6192228-Pleurochrysis_carterae.AAC.2